MWLCYKFICIFLGFCDDSGDLSECGEDVESGWG